MFMHTYIHFTHITIYLHVRIHTYVCTLYSAADDHQTHHMSLALLAQPSISSLTGQPALFESCLCETVAVTKPDNFSVKGQECSLWGIHLEASKVYYVVPSCVRAGLEGMYTLLLNIYCCTCMYACMPYKSVLSCTSLHSVLLCISYLYVYHTYTGAFLVRFFSKEPVNIEKVPVLDRKIVHGSFTRTSDVDSTGGPRALNLKKEGIYITCI